MPDYTDDLRWVSSIFTKLDTLADGVGRLVTANELTEQRIMSITDDLQSAVSKTSDAVTLLDAKVDLLITSQQNVVAQLTAAVAANTGSSGDTAAMTSAMQAAIDTLNASTASATSEAAKVDGAVTAASAAPAPVAAPAPAAPVVDTPTADPEAAAQAALAQQHTDPTAGTTGVVGAIPVTDAQIAAASPSIDSGAAITSTTPNVAPLAPSSSTVTPADGSATTP